MKRISRLFLLMVASTLLAACGLKGDLVLPERKSDGKPAVSPGAEQEAPAQKGGS